MLSENIKERILASGLQLPEAPLPGGNYSSVNVRNGIVYVAIQFPKWNGSFLYQGILGKDLKTEEGYKALQICALNTLSQINQLKGINSELYLNHIDIVYRSTDLWNDAPKVADGASDLFLNVMGEKGKHSRSIWGVSHLPKNFSAGLTCSFSIFLNNLTILNQ